MNTKALKPVLESGMTAEEMAQGMYRLFEVIKRGAETFALLAHTLKKAKIRAKK